MCSRIVKLYAAMEVLTAPFEVPHVEQKLAHDAMSIYTVAGVVPALRQRDTFFGQSEGLCQRSFDVEMCRGTGIGLDGFRSVAELLFYMRDLIPRSRANFIALS